MGKRKKPSKKTRDRARKKVTKGDVVGASELRKHSASWNPELNKAIFGKEDPSQELEAQELDYRGRHRARMKERALRGGSDSKTISSAKVSESAQGAVADAAEDVLHDAADDIKREGLTPVIDPANRPISIEEIEEAREKLKLLEYFGIKGAAVDRYRATLLAASGGLSSERN